MDFDNKTKTTENNESLEYTMVLDDGYKSPEGGKHAQKGAEVANKAVERIRSLAEDPRVTMDRLYDAYDRMFLKDPTVLDKDDIYPHSYQWRTGDRYDAGKLAILTEAVKEGKRIVDTEAYQKYVEAGRNRRFKPDTWDV